MILENLKRKLQIYILSLTNVVVYFYFKTDCIPFNSVREFAYNFFILVENFQRSILLLIYFF